MKYYWNSSAMVEFVGRLVGVAILVLVGLLAVAIGFQLGQVAMAVMMGGGAIVGGMYILVYGIKELLEESTVHSEEEA